MSTGASPPPKENAAFVACMEDILYIYSLPYDPEIPVICMDEKPYQLIGGTGEPLAARHGDIKKIDAEYERCGTCSILVFTEALAGWCYVSVRERLEIHYSPKHGSWLNIAEIELNVMIRQCLGRRIGEKTFL